MIENWFNTFKDCDYVVREIMQVRCVESLAINKRGVMVHLCDGAKFEYIAWYTDYDVLKTFAGTFDDVDFDHHKTRLIPC